MRPPGEGGGGGGHLLRAVGLLLAVYVPAGTSIHDASPLVLGVLHIGERSVSLRWEGMAMDRVMDCVLNYSANQTDLWTILDYTPMNFTFSVPDLQPATFYKFVLVCHDYTNGKHTSQPVNFTTAYEGSTPAYLADLVGTVPPPTPSTQPPLHRPTSPSQPSPLTPSPSPGGTTPTVPPTDTSPRPAPSTRPTPSTHPSPRGRGPGGVVPERGGGGGGAGLGGAVVETETSPMDIGLGVAFGFIGCGVFAMMAYFCIKEYRRRLRIRRFLQYRRQENEPFPDMDNDDDEGIVP